MKYAKILPASVNFLLGVSIPTFSSQALHPQSLQQSLLHNTCFLAVACMCCLLHVLGTGHSSILAHYLWYTHTHKMQQLQSK